MGGGEGWGERKMTIERGKVKRRQKKRGRGRDRGGGGAGEGQREGQGRGRGRGEVFTFQDLHRVLAATGGQHASQPDRRSWAGGQRVYHSA